MVKSCSFLAEYSRARHSRLADEALAIATRHGYQLVPGFQSIRDSVPLGEP